MKYTTRLPKLLRLSLSLSPSSRGISLEDSRQRWISNEEDSREISDEELRILLEGGRMREIRQKIQQDPSLHVDIVSCQYLNVPLLSYVVQQLFLSPYPRDRVGTAIYVATCNGNLAFLELVLRHEQTEPVASYQEMLSTIISTFHGLQVSKNWAWIAQFLIEETGDRSFFRPEHRDAICLMMLAYGCKHNVQPTILDLLSLSAEEFYSQFKDITAALKEAWLRKTPE